MRGRREREKGWGGGGAEVRWRDGERGTAQPAVGNGVTSLTLQDFSSGEMSQSLGTVEMLVSEQKNSKT